MRMVNAAALSDDLWTAWDWEPGIVIPLVVSAVLYARGLRLLWDEHVGRGIRVWEATCFAAGWIITGLALLSPLHELSEQFFSLHMVQHELLMVLAAPLLVLGRPLVPMIWALPSSARRFVGRTTHRAWVRAVWGGLTRPSVAFLLHGAAIWVWHAPALFQATLTNDSIHALQHTSFLGTALLFWWTIIHGSASGARVRTPHFGLAVLLLFGTTLHSGALGALLTFSRTLWYPAYAVTCRTACPLTPLEDQQLAGLIMWIPAGVAYLVASIILFASWLRASENRVHEREATRAAQWAHHPIADDLS